MTKTTFTAVACALVCALVASQAQAIDVTFHGLIHEKNVTVSHNNSSMNLRAGDFLIEFEGEQHVAYCVDLDHVIKNTWTADIAPVTVLNGGMAIAWLYDTYAQTITTGVEAAGLQVAIWEILDDFGGVLDAGAGLFRVSSPTDVRNAAQGFLNSLPTDLSNYTTTSYILMSGNSPRSQNLIVPEPGTLGLIGLSVLPLIRRRR